MVTQNIRFSRWTGINTQILFSKELNNKYLEILEFPITWMISEFNNHKNYQWDFFKYTNYFLSFVDLEKAITFF